MYKAVLECIRSRILVGADSQIIYLQCFRNSVEKASRLNTVVPEPSPRLVTSPQREMETMNSLYESAGSSYKKRSTYELYRPGDSASLSGTRNPRNDLGTGVDSELLDRVLYPL